MNIEEIGVCSFGRTTSSRCKEKLIRPFGSSSLTDIFLSKLAKVGDNVFFAGYESIFKEKCELHNVPFVQRSFESANIDEPASKIYEVLNDQPYEYFLLVNACLPFLKLDSILDFLKLCTSDEKPKFAVFKKNNFYTDQNGNPYNFSTKLSTINTKNVKQVNEFAHVFYFFKKSYFVDNGWYWNWNDVSYIEIDESLETFDIDTEEQFQMANAMWNGGLV